MFSNRFPLFPQNIAANALCEFAYVRIVSSTAAEHFLDNVEQYATANEVRKYDANQHVHKIAFYHESDEWGSWSKVGDPIMHIELRKWADVLVVAPASANTMAKIRAGICDSLLLNVVRAWDESSGPNGSKPKILCPAMNTCMWNQSVTRETLSDLEGKKWAIVGPVTKTLACGDDGMGALAPTEDIARVTRDALACQDIRTNTYSGGGWMPLNAGSVICGAAVGALVAYAVQKYKLF